jgi:stress response protein YsnF
MEEVLVVEKRLRLIEEVRVRTLRTTEQSQQREIRRRERIDIEDATKHNALRGTNGGKELAEESARVATHSGDMQAPRA